MFVYVLFCYVLATSFSYVYKYSQIHLNKIWILMFLIMCLLWAFNLDELSNDKFMHEIPIYSRIINHIVLLPPFHKHIHICNGRAT